MSKSSAKQRIESLKVWLDFSRSIKFRPSEARVNRPAPKHKR